MTKAEIKEELQMLKMVIEAKRKTAIRQSDDPMDFYDGQQRAYEECVNRLDNLIDKCFG